MAVSPGCPSHQSPAPNFVLPTSLALLDSTAGTPRSFAQSASSGYLLLRFAAILPNPTTPTADVRRFSSCQAYFGTQCANYLNCVSYIRVLPATGLALASERRVRFAVAVRVAGKPVAIRYTSYSRPGGKQFTQQVTKTKISSAERMPVDVVTARHAKSLHRHGSRRQDLGKRIRTRKVVQLEEEGVHSDAAEQPESRQSQAFELFQSSFDSTSRWGE